MQLLADPLVEALPLIVGRDTWHPESSLESHGGMGRKLKRQGSVRDDATPGPNASADTKESKVDTHQLPTASPTDSNLHEAASVPSVGEAWLVPESTRAHPISGADDPAALAMEMDFLEGAGGDVYEAYSRDSTPPPLSPAQHQDDQQAARSQPQQPAQKDAACEEETAMNTMHEKANGVSDPPATTPSILTSAQSAGGPPAMVANPGFAERAASGTVIAAAHWHCLRTCWPVGYPVDSAGYTAAFCLPAPFPFNALVHRTHSVASASPLVTCNSRRAKHTCKG